MTTPTPAEFDKTLLAALQGKFLGRPLHAGLQNEIRQFMMDYAADFLKAYPDIAIDPYSYNVEFEDNKITVVRTELELHMGRPVINCYHNITPSESNPFLGYARKHDLPYWQVINYAEFCHRTQLAETLNAVHPNRAELVALKELSDYELDHCFDIAQLVILEGVRRYRVQLKESNQ